MASIGGMFGELNRSIRNFGGTQEAIPQDPQQRNALQQYGVTNPMLQMFGRGLGGLTGKDMRSPAEITASSEAQYIKAAADPSKSSNELYRLAQEALSKELTNAGTTLMRAAELKKKEEDATRTGGQQMAAKLDAVYNSNLDDYKKEELYKQIHAGNDVTDVLKDTLSKDERQAMFKIIDDNPKLTEAEKTFYKKRNGMGDLTRTEAEKLMGSSAKSTKTQGSIETFLGTDPKTGKEKVLDRVSFQDGSVEYRDPALGRALSPQEVGEMNIRPKSTFNIGYGTEENVRGKRLEEFYSMRDEAVRDLPSTRAAVQSAQSALASLQTMRTGTMASQINTLKQYFGMSDVNVDQMNKLTAKLVLQELANLKGNPTEGERAFVMNAVARIEASKEFNVQELEGIIQKFKEIEKRTLWFVNNPTATIEQYERALVNGFSDSYSPDTQALLQDLFNK